MMEILAWFNVVASDHIATVPLFHVVNFLLFLFSVGATGYLFLIKKSEWQKILPWGVVSAGWLAFFTFLLVRDVFLLGFQGDSLVGTPTVFATTISSSLIALTGTSILGMSLLHIKEQRFYSQTPVKRNGELEKEGRELAQKILTAANNGDATAYER